MPSISYKMYQLKNTNNYLGKLTLIHGQNQIAIINVYCSVYTVIIKKVELCVLLKFNDLNNSYKGD